jgi:hypothetical protein
MFLCAGLVPGGDEMLQTAIQPETLRAEQHCESIAFLGV